MNSLRNRVQLIGHLGVTPDVKEIGNNKKVARFSLATNDSYRDKEGKQIEETQWHNIVAWGKQAELAEKYFEKGKEIALEGKLTTRSYEDKEGNKKYITEVVASEFLMLGKK